MRSIYIHIPFCISRCHYCNFVSGCDYLQLDNYVTALIGEITASSDRSQLIDTIFIGGGTPSTLSNEHFAKIFEAITNNYALSVNCEITIECNADSLTLDKIKLFAELGVNRVSMGLQSSNDETLKAIGRRHTLEQFDNAVKMLIENNITNINADVMIGLPESTESFISTVNYVSGLPITHISMYALEVHEGSVLSDNIASGLLSVASEDEQAEMYDAAKEILQKNHYNRYEISNFSLKNHNCRHNINYWKANEYYGFGLAAHGYINGYRYNNTAKMADYLCGDMVAERQLISADESAEEYVMLGLRLDAGINIDEFNSRFGCSVFESFSKINKLIDLGYLVERNGNIFIDSKYTYVLSQILTMLFD